MSDDKGGGTPAWVMTFADLMSLLLCFFVLLLSFAEMDIIKYKQVAGSMKMAFGVQREMPSEQSELSEEFIEGRIAEAPEFEMTAVPEGPRPEEVGAPDVNDPSMEGLLAAIKAAEEAAREEVQQEAIEKLTAALEQDVEHGMVDVQKVGENILITITEKASFPSGAATLRGSFLPALTNLREALSEVEGRIVVAGHTDNRPIKTAQFRSNWELSSSRAVSVVHELLKDGIIPEQRFLVEGHADSHPIAPNDTPENRAKNRRVELTILRSPEGELQKEAIDLLP